MDFGAGGLSNGAAASGALSADNGPILYTEPNRTSAVDDLRSVVIYVFIVTIFLGFFLILPGIRNEKFPTFLCITTSLIVTSIILISLFGTTWHVGTCSISAPYKAFSKDRIQGELSVRVGLRSVNITLRAQKYFEQMVRGVAARAGASLAEELEGVEARAAEEPPPNKSLELLAGARLARDTGAAAAAGAGAEAHREVEEAGPAERTRPRPAQRHTLERSNVDINYNERFYWIEPNQMRQEHQSALQRGLPYPILTAVEYLSQDEAGFSWSRQYRTAGYYSHILLICALCLCLLMFFLHCAAPRYGIYAMAALGCLMLFVNFTYYTLVPSGHQKLVIPFENSTLSLEFGWSFWLVFIGGCLSLTVGTLIALIDSLFPNYIFTTILDVDFDSHNYYKNDKLPSKGLPAVEKPTKPPFLDAQPREHHSQLQRRNVTQEDKSSHLNQLSVDSLIRRNPSSMA